MSTGITHVTDESLNDRDLRAVDGTAEASRGSPMINRAAPNWRFASQFPQALREYGIPLAILDNPPVRPQCHVFVGSKAPWFEIADDLPQYVEMPPR